MSKGILILEDFQRGDVAMSKQDRVWFITGASSGFGRALAEAAIARGDRVVAVARRQEMLAALAAKDETRVLPLALDITEPAARQRSVAEALAKFGRVDI